jgi:ketosteroid isomerase-like protein
MKEKTMQQPAQELIIPTIAQQEIERAYKKYFAALKAKDARLMAEMLTSDFTWRTLEGDILDVSKTATLMDGQVKSLLSIESADAQITDLSVQGSEATFQVTEHITSVVADENGKAQKFKSVEVFRDTMVPTPDGWKFKRAQTLSSTTEAITGE